MAAFLDTLEMTEISAKVFAIADHPLRFKSDVAKRMFTVPVGFFTDFYSVPFWMPTIYVLIAALCDRSPAALHDWLYYSAVTTREMADNVLREAMRTKGIPAWKCDATYWGVRAGGWSAWNEHRKLGDPLVGKFQDSPDILSLNLK
jgi:hypothetical protein